MKYVHPVPFFRRLRTCLRGAFIFPSHFTRSTYHNQLFSMQLCDVPVFRAYNSSNACVRCLYSSKMYSSKTPRTHVRRVRAIFLPTRGTNSSVATSYETFKQYPLLRPICVLFLLIKDTQNTRPHTFLPTRETNSSVVTSYETFVQSPLVLPVLKTVPISPTSMTHKRWWSACLAYIWIRYEPAAWMELISTFQ